MPMVPQQPNLVKKPRLEWGRPIRCTAEVTYTGAKAEEFQPWKLQKAIALLKADLTYIKLVFPKDSDIEVLRRGVVRFFWLSWEDSVSGVCFSSLRTFNSLPLSRCTKA